MKIFSIAFILTSIEGNIRSQYCEIVSNDPDVQCYQKETLTSVAHSPNQLAVDRNTNTLYLSFDFGHEEYVPAIINIENGTVNVLKGVKDAFAMYSDPASENIYFGGSSGIYRYDPIRKKLDHLNIKNLDIWWLCIRKKLYFIKFPSLNAYYYENRAVHDVPQLRGNVIHQFVFDDDDNIYFINSTGLYRVMSDSTDVVLIKGDLRLLAMATDNNGNVYVCGEDGIYQVTTVDTKVKKVINVQGVLGLTFDRYNNIIYSNSHEVVRVTAVSAPQVDYNPDDQLKDF